MPKTEALRVGMFAPAHPLTHTRPAVKCPHCGHTLFDGLVIKSRIIRLTRTGAEAKCRCKAWVKVPVRYDHGPCHD